MEEITKRKICKNCGHMVIYVQDGLDKQWMHGFIEFGNWIDGGSEVCHEDNWLEGTPSSKKKREDVMAEFNKDVAPILEKYKQYHPRLDIDAYCGCDKPEPIDVD